MKKLVCAALLVMAGNASASIVENLHLDFQSGATFDGTVTFNDGYLGMTDVDGMLVGGSNNYNRHFDQTWWTATNQANPQNYFGQGLVDWFVADGFATYIGITWDAALSSLNGHFTAVNTNDSYTFGEISTGDKIVGFRSGNTNVPEPAGIMMVGLGLFGLAARRALLKK